MGVSAQKKKLVAETVDHFFDELQIYDVIFGMDVGIDVEDFLIAIVFHNLGTNVQVNSSTLDTNSYDFVVPLIFRVQMQV